ncbi:hypothetical protein ABB28_10240 [Stenotrophomonas chelatiphaga]|uniref:Polysaccharide pyruvyl transferase domain-containing protein n=1 Tax=Stenotrophomonas chelatiphaga TaxID=517011 RepID=A0A0R0D8J7_9GAMM|nr:hypothetical protein ABB28_10240 [Stenotrophomonas chelatiphaga]
MPELNIKTSLIKVLGPLSDAAVRRFVLRKLTADDKREQSSHVVLAPSSRGNLGDEAMLTSTITTLRAMSSLPVTVLCHRTDDDWSHIDPSITQVSIEGFFSPALWAHASDQLVSTLKRARTFSVLGADIMDGAYSSSRTFRRLLMLEVALKLGVDATILGFSYSDKANPDSMAYLSRLGPNVTKYARDPLSFERLRRICSDRLELVADTAFLLRPSDSLSEQMAVLTGKIAELRTQGKKIIAFNANPLGAAMSAGAKRGNESVSGLDSLVQRNVESILRSDPAIHLIAISHDPREPHSDARVLEDVAASLPADISARFVLATRGISARDVKLLCSMTDLVVTGRMHMGIAALGTATPCYFLDFQGKVRGLLRHFEIEEMCCDWATYSSPELYSEQVTRFLKESPHYKEKLAARLPSIKQLAAKNFERFKDQV